MASRNPGRPLAAVKNQFRPVSDWIGHISDVGVCPYDPTHVMKSHKLMRHIIKCEQQQRKRLISTSAIGDGGEGQCDRLINDGLEKCPYNSLHRYPCGKSEEHFRTCKARAADIMARIDAGESLEDIDARYRSKSVPSTN